MKRQRARLLTVLMLAAMVGCGSAVPPDVVQRVEPWSAVPGGQVLVTRHYRIHTTLDDPRRNRELAAALEAALARFEELTGAVIAEPDRGTDGALAGPLEVMVFATRREWEAHTRRAQPGLAEQYLRIRRGGYTVGDRSVLYDIGRGATLGVAMHEAWHQFCARRFAARMPPALEEGLASRFDQVRFVAGRAEFVEAPSPARLAAVRAMLRENRVVPLRRLLSMHAGDVLGGSRGRVEAFYAQSWALGEFLLFGEDGRHAAALRAMFASLALAPADDEGWCPEASLTVFTRHFGEPERMDPVFRRFLVTLTR